MMKLLVITLSLLASLAGCAVPQDQNVPHRADLLREPITRRAYYLYVSSHYDRNRPAPVIISLQGTAPYDTADGQVREWKKLAEDHGAILICPTLKSSDGILTSGDGTLLVQLLEDERFVLTILGELHYKYNIDRRNIFLTCWSGGGYPLYFIGLRHPDIFAAIVARQATFRQSAIDGWYPETAKRIPVLVFHGTMDFVPIQNQTREAAAYLKAQGFREVSLTTTDGGHTRHPEVAMDFFLRHWSAGLYVRGPNSPHLAAMDWQYRGNNQYTSSGQYTNGNSARTP